MPELSNLLRQRLVAQQKQDDAARVHPDADTLTAFSEQLLPAAERQQVVTHLAACADCRDIVALSRPELAIPETQPVFTPAAVPFWRRFFKPAFGLGGAVAVMAVVAILVLQHPQQSIQPQSNQEAKVAPAPAAPAAEHQSSAPQTFADNTNGAVQPQSVTPLAGDQSGAANRNKARTEPLLTAGVRGGIPARGSIIQSKTSAAAPVQPALTAGLQKQDYLNNAFFENSSADAVSLGQNGLASAPAPRNLSTEARLTTNSGQIASAYDVPANSSKSNVRLLTPPPPEHSSIFDKIKIAGAHSIFRPRIASPAIKSNSLVTSAMSTRPGTDLQKEQPAEMAGPATADSGLTQPALASRALSASSFASAAGSAPLWRIAGGKLLRSTGSEWEEAYPGASFQFTVVNPHGSEVWAGGSQATLIHSRDGGAHWETARLGEAASGAVMSIVFLGNNVQIKTSDDQSWSSTDGGKTWTQN